MKRRILIAVLAVASAFACAFGFAACDGILGGGNGGGNIGGDTGNKNDCASGKHSYQWQYDTIQHWQKCVSCGNETNNGKHVIENGECKICGYARTECEEHIYDKNVIKVLEAEPSSCTEAGHSALYVCTECLKLFTDIKCTEYVGTTDTFKFEGDNDKLKLLQYCKALPLEEHTPVTDEAVPATCTTKGKTEGSHCEVCNTVIKEQQETDLTDHDYSATYAIKEAAVSEYSACSHCGKFENKDLSYTMTLNEDGESYTLEKASGADLSGKITLPHSFNDKPITHIGGSAFQNCSSITGLTVPDGVTTIGFGAFAQCEALDDITLPDSLTGIGNYAFSDCPIENATVPAIACPYINNSSLKNLTVTSGSIGYNALQNCTSLESATLCEGVTSIESYAFGGCTSLTSVVIPKNITYISGYAFNGCYIQSVTVPTYAIFAIKNPALRSVVISAGDVEGCDIIEEQALNNCYSLTSVTILDGITDIRYSAFRNCTSLENIELSSTVTNIDRPFWGCRSLANITVASNNAKYHCTENCLIDTASKTMILGCKNSVIPDDGSVTSIGISAFGGCSWLDHITIPESVQYIGEAAFSGCTSLESITIPASVLKIYNDAFGGCKSLVINCEVAEKPSDWDENWFGESSSYNNRCIVIWDYKNNDKDASGKQYAIIDGLRYMLSDGRAELIGQLSNITTANIPATVSYRDNTYRVVAIRSGAFFDCDLLTSVTIPESVGYISDYEFNDCILLESITVSENNENYSSQDGILYNKAKTEFVHIPKAIKGAVTIPSGIRMIYPSAFSDCKSLESISMPESVTVIEYSAFSGCTSLKNINIPKGITSIEKFTFKNCSSLTNITIPDGVKSIGFQAFSGCKSLESVIMPESVTSIMYQVFSGCDKLRYNEYGDAYYLGNSTNLYVALIKAQDTAKVHENTKVIAGSAFEYCNYLESVSLPDGLTGIGEFAFSGCASIENIVIPDTVTIIEHSAFSSCSSLKSIIIPNGVTVISSYVFSGCSNLASITISNGVTSIERYAFDNCEKLENIIFNGTIEQWNTIEKDDDWDINSGDYTIHCTDGDIAKG